MSIQQVFMITRKTTWSLFWAIVLVKGAFRSAATSADRLRQTATTWLDALGRRTGTRGANDAAHYIAGEFSLPG